ncbi:MAG: NADH-quinone oxidoreductase subunit N [Gemmatimonadota bacterium]|nr:NADH-quinone oxidoreductase subunit N [Gemmatimonadota bacterium]
MLLDYGSSFHYVLALLPELVLAIWGMGVLLAGAYRKRDGSSGQEAGWLALAGLALAAVANGWLHSGVSEVGAAGMIAVDRFRLFANWVLILGAGLSVVISLPYVARQKLQAEEYYCLILFAVVGMMFMAAARDLMIIFLGLELMSIGVYALAGFNRRDRRSAEAGLKYFLLGAFSSGFLLFGIALVYGAAGTTNVHAVAMAVADGTAASALMVPGAALLATGFAFKVSAVPFHMWTPDVYEGAPTPVTAFMAATVKTAGFVAFLRVFLVGLEGLHGEWADVLWWISAITMVAGNVVALVQSSVKRMLAYSSIAHGGYLLVALVAANDTATSGMLFYLLVYTIMTVGAFAVVVTVGNQSEANARIEDYGGFGWRKPVLGVFMTVLLLSLAGFPGTAGFIAKYHLLLGAAESRLWTLSVILVLTTVVSYWYYLRVAWYMWMKEAPEGVDSAEPAVTPFATRLVLAASVAVIILAGVFPGAALDLAAGSAEGLRGVSEAAGSAAGP